MCIRDRVEEGEKAGVLRYELKGKVLGEVEIVTEGAVKKAGYRDYLKKLRRAWMMESPGQALKDEK